MKTWQYLREENKSYDSNTGKPLVSIYHWVKQDKEHIALVCDAGAKSIARAKLLAAAPALLDALMDACVIVDGMQGMGPRATTAEWRRMIAEATGAE